jgi:hypothetical protein
VLDADDVLARLGGRTGGLAEEEAARRLSIAGADAVRSYRVRALPVPLRQLRLPLLVLLAVTAVASAFLGEATDAVIIGVILATSVEPRVGGPLGQVGEPAADQRVHQVRQASMALPCWALSSSASATSVFATPARRRPTNGRGGRSRSTAPRPIQGRRDATNPTRPARPRAHSEEPAAARRAARLARRRVGSVRAARSGAYRLVQQLESRRQPIPTRHVQLRPALAPGARRAARVRETPEELSAVIATWPWPKRW